jgi:hypothetical protein
VRPLGLPFVLRHVPASARRLLQVGSGAVAASASLQRERPGLEVVALEGSPGAGLSKLFGGGERFDAFVLDDVLERVDDPVGLLGLARRIAEPSAALVASVPNVGHVSLVCDLIQGRFDPVEAGLGGAVPLRWFTRRSLAEALEEAGWTVASVEGVAGAPARDAGSFLDLLSGWPGCDRESLSIYQWIGLARANGADSAAGPA